MNRVRRFKMVLWSILGLAAAVGITRFWFGLGSVTKLTDGTPWGLWIGFDVVSGVALAAGGFLITATVYILKKKEFNPIVKPAVLTAFLGYLAVVAGLMFDLGMPWNVWRPVVNWQHHSALFEVAMCVTFYTGVLLLEFLPVPLEETGLFSKIRKFLIKIKLPLVILGIMLSTLHQSSLGSLFLLTPFKLHPLWYSNILPVLFFISAISLGLMMVTFESLLTTYLYHRKAETHLLSKLGRVAAWVIAFYIVVRFIDLAVTGKLGLIFGGGWESYLFLSEILIAFIIPLILLSMKSVRRSVKGLWICSSMVIFGTVFNRVNVSGFAMQSTVGFYFPSWSEIVISAGVVSGAALVFLFILEKCSIWECKPADPESAKEIIPHFDRFSHTTLIEPSFAGRVRYSLAFIIFLALGFALLPGSRVGSKGIEPTPVYKARGNDVLFIDGNRNYYGVPFDHVKHQDLNSIEGNEVIRQHNEMDLSQTNCCDCHRSSEFSAPGFNHNWYADKNYVNMACAECHLKDRDTSCAVCHHMNVPLDQNSGCYECHLDMYTSADAFRHQWHSSTTGAGISCYECHAEGEAKTAENAKDCSSCHRDLIPENAKFKTAQYTAPGYADAMHLLCVRCHKKQALTTSDLENLGRCPTCHKETSNREGITLEDLPNFQEYSGWVTLTPMEDEE